MRNMADSSNPTASTSSETQLPLSIILVIAIGAYMVVIVALLVLRQFLVARGSCTECTPCGKDDGSFQCCDCWVAFAEACNCCAYPNKKSCLDSICGPPSNRCTLTRCFSCDSCENEECCGPDSGCNCAGCNFECQVPECHCSEIDCFCFRVQLKT